MIKVDALEYVMDLVNQGDLDSYFDEMYWKDEFTSNRALDHVLCIAKSQGIELINLTSAVEDELYEGYRSCEKGIS